ncbi:MAG: hypothetical protein JXR42_03225 [Gammaproteobacteria bacterium]|nr:hypothetical protein [Gammaproteobacteria bacterium]
MGGTVFFKASAIAPYPTRLDRIQAGYRIGNLELSISEENQQLRTLGYWSKYIQLRKKFENQLEPLEACELIFAASAKTASKTTNSTTWQSSYEKLLSEYLTQSRKKPYRNHLIKLRKDIRKLITAIGGRNTKFRGDSNPSTEIIKNRARLELGGLRSSLNLKYRIENINYETSTEELESIIKEKIQRAQDCITAARTEISKIRNDIATSIDIETLFRPGAVVAETLGNPQAASGF